MSLEGIAYAATFAAIVVIVFAVIYVWEERNRR
jgi:hypothetical protein